MPDKGGIIMQNPVTTLSRRKVIVAGGAAAAVGAVAASPLSVPIARETRELLATQTWARSILSLADASYEEWAEVVGSVFSLGGGVSMRLSGVSPFAADRTRPMRVGRERAFLAVFEVANGHSLASDLIYTAHHGQYGPLQIFLSAAGEARAPGRMLAVFN